MAIRKRSPNYPAISLPDAIERVRKLHEMQHQSPEERKVIAQHLGYAGLNGLSLKLLSALIKYGLLEKVESGNLRVSDRAINILFPEDDSRLAAIKEAAFAPDLFAEMVDRWPHHPPTDESLRSYLIRRRFAESAIDDVIRNYRDTIELVARESVEYDSSVTQPEDQTMSEPQIAAPATPPIAPSPSVDFRRVTLVDDRLEGSFSLRDPKDVGKLIRALEANMALLDPTPGPFATEYTDDEEGREAAIRARELDDEFPGDE